MTWYHVFLTYRDADGAICSLIQYDIASAATLHAQLMALLQAQRPLILDRHVIPSIQAIQHLQVYQSTRPFAALRLPDGASPLDHQPDTVRFLFERGIVDAVAPYTPAFRTPSPRADGAIEPSATGGARAVPGLEGVLDRVTAGLARGLRRWRLLSPDPADPLPDARSPHLYLYYVLCGYAALGNTVLTGLVRWVETGSQPTWLRALLRVDADALAWPMLASMLVGLGLLGMYYLVQWRGWSRRLLTLMNLSFLTVILAANLINVFAIPAGATTASGALLIYVVPYLLLIGVVAAITFTFATPQPSSHHVDRGRRDPWPLRRQNGVLVAVTLTLILGAVTAHLRLSSDYRIAYPLWFGYLLGGLVLWWMVMRGPVVAVRRSVLPASRVSGTNVSVDLALPALPPLDVAAAREQGWPALPSLDPHDTA
jgi:hypothetical protein